MDERFRRTWVGLTTAGVTLACACAVAGNGRYLVYADVDDRSQPSIRVLDTLEPQQPARRLTEGTLAAWSWH